MSNLLPRLSAALEGRYAIERQLGEGGMAVVYLAEDLRHDRKVALKVLKPELAALVGAERFLAEIKTTANLRHPHILPLFDSGEADGFLFYVMPYVEGETLRERIDRDRQLPVDEAVAIASAVAQALQHAHERGIIHRDIKPANILIQDGQPVVSDFGIALAVGSAGGARLTETGLSVGTPFYMSPEQATGDQHVGPASDIYSLAAVLYEMLVGDPPYIGSTAQAVLGKIIQGEPVSATAARGSVPAHVDAAIRKALEKLPADRFADAKAFAGALADRGFRHGKDAERSSDARPWKLGAIAAGAVAVIAIGVALGSIGSARSGPGASVIRFSVPLGDGLFLGGEQAVIAAGPYSPSLALSPDGTMLVYAAWDTADDGSIRSQLYQRRLDQEEAEPIQDTDGAANPFFSPDGAWIGFFAERALRRVPLAGGTAETIVPSATAWLGGASWGDNGTIAYTAPDGVHLVPASGGEPRLAAPDATLPHFLPGGRTLLFNLWPKAGPTNAEIRSFDVDSGEGTLLLTDAMNPVYVTTGHLLFLRRGTLMAVEFDPERVQVTGEPFVVLEDVMQALAMPNSYGETGAAQIAVSASGDLAYAAGGVFPEQQWEVVRVRENGSAEPLDIPPGPYLHLQASPTGDRIAYNVESMRSLGIVVHDLVRGVTQRLAIDAYSTSQPTWNAAGDTLVFGLETEDGQFGFYSMPADGRSPPERRSEAGQPRFRSTYSTSADGTVAFDGGGDIWVLPPDGEAHPVFTSRVRELYATFSPDGRWLAYVTSETGRMDVYVRPYPGPGLPTRVSVDGGDSPAWSLDGRRIYFRKEPEIVTTRSPDGAPGTVLMAADVTTDPDFRVGRIRTFIDPWRYNLTAPVRSYDVLPDGSLVALRMSQENMDVRGRELHVVVGFGQELQRRDGR